MLVHEAALIATLLEEIEPASVLDLGSGSRVERTIIQPHIAAAFAGHNVVWTDLRESKGVIACDVTKPETLTGLPRCEVVTACSILEHVEDREAALAAIVSLVEKHLIVSVPRIYPYHECPIDNMWRPSPDELASVVKECGLKVTRSYATGPERFCLAPNASASVVLAYRPKVS